jgi:RNA polymerase sigma-70 factor (ECF subfamily)
MADREKELITRVAADDSKAFETLYNTYARKVYAYLHCKRIDDETAADILQETFLAAWRSAARYQGSAQPLTWLIGIARHKLADALRMRERTRTSPLEDFDRGHDPLKEHAEKLTLRSAVDALDEEQRELLHLVFTLGMSYAEASQTLEIPRER